jgi:hypothetical protein
VRPPTGLGHQQFDPGARQFIAGVSKHLTGAAVGQDNASPSINHEDRLGG